jgi:hypothetical protein
MPPGSLIVVIALIGVVAASAIVLVRRRAERARLAGLQRLLAERLGADPALAGLALRAHVRRSWGRGIEIDLDGEVPSVWQRYAATRVVERELARRGLHGVVVDRVRVAWRAPQPGREHSA